MKKLKSALMSIVISASFLTGCTNSSDNETKDQGGSNDNPVAITLLADSNDGWVRNFNPFSPGTYQFVQGFMHEYLVLFDDMNNNKEHMWLAEDIISEPDNKTLTIKVRQGIKWSDGEDFNAEDVAFSFLITKEHPGLDKTGEWGENGKFEEVKIVDDYTVQVVMREENRFHRTSLRQKMMVPEHIWSKVEDPATYVYENPVVTGPFSVVKTFTPEMVVLGRNENYWKKEDLKIDEMRIPQFNGNDGALSLLQSGSVDWAHIFIPDIESNYIQGDENRKFWYGPNDAVRISFNYMTENENNLKAFNSPEFKKAISMSVDRKGIIDSAIFGYLDPTVPSVTGLPPALFEYKNDEAQKLLEENSVYDLEKAKQVLTDGGFVDKDGDGWVDNPDGTPIEFEILSPAGWSDWNDGAAIASEGMREIGINATAKAVDLGLIIESWESGAHDVLYGAYGLSSNIWEFYFNTIGDASKVKTPTWWSVTQTNYVNEEINNMIAKMPTATDEELSQIVSDIEMYFTENMINIPLFHNGNWFVYNTERFTGWSDKENPYCQPASFVHDMKLYHLLNLEPVK